MKKTTYAIFSEGELANFHLYPLSDLPVGPRLIMQSKADHIDEKLTLRKLSFAFQESIHLEAINNMLQATNFFESFHDGIRFPFRGKGAMFVAFVCVDEFHLGWISIRVSLSQHITEKAICDMLVEENIIVP